MEYKIVFSVIESGFRYWYFPLLGIPFLIATIYILLHNRKLLIAKIVGSFGLNQGGRDIIQLAIKE